MNFPAIDTNRDVTKCLGSIISDGYKYVGRY